VPVTFGAPPRPKAEPRTTTEAVCDLCGGEGARYVAENTRRMCICRVRQIIRSQLGALLDVPSLPQPSPLFRHATENLKIAGTWDDVAPHVRQTVVYCIYRRLPEVWSWGLHTDHDLLSAYLAKPAASGDDEAQLTMRDLMDRDRALVIIRLGFLGYKNAAMPGILYEALRYREGLATWLVIGDDAFEKGHLSWDEKVSNYIDADFQPVEIDGDGD
jgi:hypothetical protein